MDESHRASSVASGEAPLSMRQIAGILTRALEDEGYALRDLLAETTISPARIDTMGEHSDWGDFQQLVRNALRLTENPALGLWFGRRVRLASLGLLGFAAISSPSLMDLARLFTRYGSLHATHVRVQIEFIEIDAGSQGKRSVPSVRLDEDKPHDDIAVFLMEATMRFAADVAQTVWGNRMDGLRFELSYDEPAHWKSVSFEYPVQFSRPAHRMFVVDPEAAFAPLLNGDSVSLRGMEPLLERDLQRQAEDRGVLARARDAIQEAFRTARGDIPDATEMAALLGCSGRDLRRALTEAGLDYRQLMNEVRRELAEESLSRTQQRVHDIALRLGYRDEANFRRAFRRWTGLSPAAFRAERQG